MTAILATVADAVVRQINAESFGETFTFQAERNYADFEMELSEEGTLRVDVVPATLQMEMSDRESPKWVASIDIGLRYKFPQVESVAGTGRLDPDHIDPLVELTEEILAYLQSPDARVLSTYEEATWKDESKIRTIAPGNVLRTQRQFLAIIRASYDVNP